MAKYNSPFVETEMLLAAGEDDWEEVDRLLSTMLPGERTRYRRVMGDLQLAVANYIENNDAD